MTVKTDGTDSNCCQETSSVKPLESPWRLAQVCTDLVTGFHLHSFCTLNFVAHDLHTFFFSKIPINAHIPLAHSHFVCYLIGMNAQQDATVVGDKKTPDLGSSPTSGAIFIEENKDSSITCTEFALKSVQNPDKRVTFPVTVGHKGQRAKIYRPAKDFPFYRISFKSSWSAIGDLEKAGFVNRGGKGSHRNFIHPKGPRITISGNLRDDAFPYQERQVRRRIEESKQ